MWQMSSVFSHESAQRNDAEHVIDENVLKTHGRCVTLGSTMTVFFEDIFIYIYIYSF